TGGIVQLLGAAKIGGDHHLLEDGCGHGRYRQRGQRHRGSQGLEGKYVHGEPPKLCFVRETRLLSGTATTGPALRADRWLQCLMDAWKAVALSTYPYAGINRIRFKGFIHSELSGASVLAPPLRLCVKK